MRKGKLAAQVAHASVNSVLNRVTDPRVKLWLETGMAKIVVGCDSQDELFQLIEHTQMLYVPFTVIKDAGLTELEPGTMTCVAIGPDEDFKIDKITGELKLL